MLKQLIEHPEALASESSNQQQSSEQNQSETPQEDESNQKESKEQSSDNGIDSPDMMGITPLLWAVMHKHEDCAQYLVEKGADVNWEGSSGDRPLHYSCAQGQGELSRCKLENRIVMRLQLAFN